MPATLESNVPQSIRDFFAGTNAFDSDAMIAPFTEDGLVNDIHASSGVVPRSSGGPTRRASLTTSLPPTSPTSRSTMGAGSSPRLSTASTTRPEFPTR
jgi:hypothetical protein